ncbi:MAG: hypothetical protein LBJ59_08710 [Zoogloeaceae bacterium]|jgi:hypothetical protein|nr:hypothetical protein [Zoogloeaceae bacterium]
MIHIAIRQLTRELPPRVFPPRVFHSIYRRRLTAANEAIRRLRTLGVKTLRVEIPVLPGVTEIVVDKNPHCILAEFDGHVTVQR